MLMSKIIQLFINITSARTYVHSCFTEDIYFVRHNFLNAEVSGSLFFPAVLCMSIFADDISGRFLFNNACYRIVVGLNGFIAQCCI